MNNKQLLSVIIPVYNVEKYLDRCIRSVIGQSYENLEIILVDDGSTDNSPNLCDEWIKRDERIRVIHKINGGLSDARNAGLEVARGELITFVDSDDYIMLDMYSQMIEALNLYDADISVCGDFFVNEEKQIYKIENVHELSDIEVFSKQEAIEILCMDRYIVSHAWDKIYKRKVIIGERFPIDHNYEDIYVMHNIFLNACKIVHINQPKYFYIQREGSIVKTPSLKNQNDLLEAYVTRYKKLENVVSNTIKWEQLNIIIEVLSVCSQQYNVKNFRNVINFINLKLNEFMPIFALNNKRKFKFFFSKSNLNYIIKPTRLKNVIKNSFFNDFIINHKEKKKYKETNIEEIMNSEIFLVGVPEYGNLGDQLIAESEFLFLENIFNDSKISQIKENDIKYNFRRIKNTIGDGKLIIMQGGGNLGDAWPDQEKIRKKVVRYFRTNNIVIMPQSFIIKNNKIVKKIKKTYSKDNVFLTVREEMSKKIADNLDLSNDVLLAPDIALYLSEGSRQRKCGRSGIGICLRQDLESVLEFSKRIQILNMVSSLYSVKIFDTVINDTVSLSNRKNVIEKMLDYISRFEVVITDRLHCMIMSYITETPCIVLTNSTGKTLGVYEWIKDSNFIITLDKLENMNDAIESLLNLNNCNKEKKFSNNKFYALQNLLKEKGEANYE